MIRWRSPGLVVALLLAACAAAEPQAPVTTGAATTTTIVASTAAATTVVLPTTTTAPIVGPTVEVPEVAVDSAPVVDGTIEVDEWAGATVVTMDDGAGVRLLQSGGFVYVGIAAEEMGAANLLIAGGDVVRVLHSSAALGSARYEPDAGTWVLTKDFDWCCRSVSDAAARTELLAQEGWQANIDYSGTAGHVEYRVLIEDGSSMALSYVVRDGTVAAFPAELDDASRQPLYGRRKEIETFSFDGWATLRTRSGG